jgi:hypothetical protein
MIYTFLDLAKEVLIESKSPMTYQEIWQRAEEKGLTKKLRSSGKTPWHTLGARLFVDIRDHQDSLFIKVGKRPARFFLTERASEVPNDVIAIIEKEEAKPEKEISTFHERVLHPLLTYFVSANPAFGRGREILTKTIFHEKSEKRGYSEWLYPDMIGVYFPLEDWEPDIIELGKIADNKLIKLYSFELKKNLNKGNYRESYFQAVSNSSWAHEGYLVASEIKQDDDFLSELERLTLSFGIGIVQLNINDFDSSNVLFPATPKTSLDLETMNKLCSQNKDFKKFVQDVKIDFDSRRIHRSEYDKILDDPLEYIKNKIKI